jgi:hypothetical protein
MRAWKYIVIASLLGISAFAFSVPYNVSTICTQSAFFELAFCFFHDATIAGMRYLPWVIAMLIALLWNGPGHRS